MNTHGQRTLWPSTDTVVITDAGLETWLVFNHGVDLPAFAAYPLAATPEGRALLVEYYGYYAEIARSIDAAVLLEAPTWRANPDWAAVLGHDRTALAEFISASLDVVVEVRNRWTGDQPFLVGGTVGPRGDGYRIDSTMDIDTACDYHSFQIGRMAAAGADVVTALTMGYVEEAAGIARAAETAGLPVIVSFTLETDGRLPSGTSLAEAIAATDLATSGYPKHYMINCAHPAHFDHVLDATASWADRIGGLRANASQLSHTELDEMVELDEGDPDDLAARYVALRSAHAQPPGPWRLLRHRPPPRRGDCRRMACGGSPIDTSTFGGTGGACDLWWVSRRTVSKSPDVRRRRGGGPGTPEGPCERPRRPWCLRGGPGPLPARAGRRVAGTSLGGRGCRARTATGGRGRPWRGRRRPRSRRSRWVTRAPWRSRTSWVSRSTSGPVASW